MGYAEPVCTVELSITTIRLSFRIPYYLPLKNTFLIMMDKLRRILIAEDDDDSRIALKMMLKLSKFDVIEAIDGRQAVDSVFNNRPDLVLMDLSLPVIDGLQATREIRQQPEFQSLPIIFVTGYDNQETIDRIHATGGTDYVNKPIEFDDLKKKIESYLPANLAGRG